MRKILLVFGLEIARRVLKRFCASDPACPDTGSCTVARGRLPHLHGTISISVSTATSIRNEWNTLQYFSERQVDGTPRSGFRDVAFDPESDQQPGHGAWNLLTTVRADLDVHATDLLSALLQNVDHVDRRTRADRFEKQVHGRRAGLTVSVDRGSHLACSRVEPELTLPI